MTSSYADNRLSRKQQFAGSGDIQKKVMNKSLSVNSGNRSSRYGSRSRSHSRSKDTKRSSKLMISKALTFGNESTFSINNSKK